MQDDPSPHSFGDRAWRLVQGARFSSAERLVLRRVLGALLVTRDAEKLASLRTAGSREAWLPGELIVEQGEEASSLCLLVSGSVQVEVNGHAVEELLTGEFFGEIGLLTGAPRSASVRASGRVVVLRLPSTAIDEKVREALWAYAAERRFMNLRELPVHSGDARRVWYVGARHVQLAAGEFRTEVPWLFVYHGELELDGERVQAPAVVRGGSLNIPEAGARVALLSDPMDLSLT